jgi:putative heme-binding domain-containing protein
MTCHNAWAEYTLAFNAPQLCGEGRLLKGARRDTSLAVQLSRDGYIRRVDDRGKELPPFDDASAAKEPSIPVQRDLPANTAARARAYLHVNCAHCHRFGGGGSVSLELDFGKSLKETGILDVRPKQGDFGIADARIVSPGNPFQSVLLYRMAKFGRGHMPHIGYDHPHAEGIALVTDWIAGMKPDARPIEYPKDASGYDAALRSVETAMPLAHAFRMQYLGGEQDKVILDAAAKLPAGPVRELFEGYLPPDPKGRKIGANPRPTPILALKGDPKNGETLFNTKDLKCAQCHKVGDKGTAVGPELTTIGKTRTRAELLESLLEPSRRVEPQYAAYLVKTGDGRALTGLLLKRDEKGLVLKDSDNKEHALAADNVESVQPSRVSLMPDGLMAGLTPQEAADLLEYLVQRK